MKIVFCDDDAALMEKLLGLVKAFFKKTGLDMPEFETFSSGDAVIDSGVTADIAFLDVEMPGRSGIIAGATLMKRNPYARVIIVSAYRNYLDDAMRFHVFRYLDKPVDKERLIRILKDALFQSSTEAAELAVETPTSVERVSAHDIFYLESNGRHTKIVMRDRVLESVSSLNECLERLRPLSCFYHCYRGVVVNMRFISSFDREKIQLRCGDVQHAAYLSKRKYASFKATYMMFLEYIK